MFDGHGGCSCSDFLRDNLHRFIITDQAFPSNVPKAIQNGFLRADDEFLRYAGSRITQIDISGSCACVMLVVDSYAYVGNVGDSRGVLSLNHGRRVEALSNDHKPNSHPEKARIESAGGAVYK